MREQIKDYLSKLLEVGVNINEEDTLIIYMPEEANEIEEALEELKDKYNLKQLIFIKSDFKKLYNFLKNDPTDKEMYDFIDFIPSISDSRKLKAIHFDYLTNEYCPYYNYILNYYFDRYQRYDMINRLKNKNFFDLTLNIPSTYTICPTKDWSYKLLGDENKREELWNLITKTVPDIKELKNIISNNLEITKLLNELKINSLNFYTDKGTDLNVKLSKYSKWITAEGENKVFLNFPSYEICTSPNCFSSEGKVILTKPSFLSGCDRVDSAELIFSKGKIVDCNTDDEFWKGAIMYRGNNLYRIGEVALVPHNNPISNLNQTFDNILLDENTGCHIALGDSFYECITVPKNLLEKNGRKYYRFNQSNYHQDLTIGDDSISVEAKVGSKTKTLIRSGKWEL